MSFTSTASFTPTISDTVTISPTITDTDTITPTVTITETNTVTITNTYTISPTRTDTIKIGHVCFEINETDSATQPQRIDIFMDLWYDTSDEPIGMGTNENKGVSYMEFIFNNFIVDSIKKEFDDNDDEWNAPQKFTNIGVVFESNGISATMFPLLKTDGPIKILSLTGKYKDNMSKEDVSLDLTRSRFRATAIIYDYDDYADKTVDFKDGNDITGVNGATTGRKVLFTHEALEQ